MWCSIKPQGFGIFPNREFVNCATGKTIQCRPVPEIARLITPPPPLYQTLGKSTADNWNDLSHLPGPKWKRDKKHIRQISCAANIQS